MTKNTKAVGGGAPTAQHDHDQAQGSSSDANGKPRVLSVIRTSRPKTPLELLKWSHEHPDEHADWIREGWAQDGCLPAPDKIDAELADFINTARKLWAQEAEQTRHDRAVAEGAKARAQTMWERATRATARSGAYALTELGNAERIADYYGHKLRYVQAWKKWLAWDGRRWARDGLGVEVTAAKEMVKTLYGEIAEMMTEAGRKVSTAPPRPTQRLDWGAAIDAVNRDEKVAEGLLKWAKTSSSAKALIAAARLAQSEDPIAAEAEAFDRDPWLLTVMNGTIDLRTGELRKHDPEHMITRVAPVEYDPKAKSPIWDAFIERILPDKAVRTWVQRGLGYAMTGKVIEQIIMFFIGKGQNGKSTLLGRIQNVLGDYAFQGPVGLVMATKNGTDDSLGRRQRMTVQGRRLVVVQETPTGHLNEAQIKALTGDRVSGARVYEEEKEFLPTHQLIISANHKPRIRGRDLGIRRRVKLIPFEVVIPDSEKDIHLDDKLDAEALPAILAWMVQGCLDWQREGLPDVPAIQVATTDYLRREDHLAEFYDDCTRPGDYVVQARLYDVYKTWCIKRHETPWAYKTFGDGLEEDGHTRERKTVDGKTARVYVGLVLKPMMERDS